MARILAIDYGTKRCGIAVTDPSGTFVSPLDTVASHELMNFLVRYQEKEPVSCLVMGKAMRLDDTPSESYKYARQFADAFKKRFPAVRVAWMDERFTSRMAVQEMVQAGMKKKDRRKKENIDKMSAALILSSFLEMENN